MKKPPRILLPNRLSFLRMVIGLIIPLLIFYPTGDSLLSKTWSYWTAILLFLFGAFTDFWDGWMARRHCLETPFGKILDPLADKVFILAAMTSFAVKGIYSYWFLVPIYLREIVVTFCRTVWLYQGNAIGAERAGKLKLCLQLVSVLLSFLYLGYPTSIIAQLNYLFLLSAVAVTIYSGFSFFRHNQELLKDKKFAKTVATLGVGYLKPIPGTYGSLLGLAMIPFIVYDPLLHLAVFMTFLGLAYFFIPRIGLRHEEDPLEIVIDEVCGILLSFWAVPFTLWSAIIGFLLFRILDSKKIFPIKWLEDRKGVHGIMLDDLGAGVYTWLVLKILFH